MRGLKMRVPSSKLLQQFYRLTGANPTVVAWGETPTALKQGVADALDPSVGALYTFGFIDILEAITLVDSVPDAQMFAANYAWFQCAAEGPADRVRGGEREDAGRELRADSGRAEGLDGRARQGRRQVLQADRGRAQAKWVEAAGEQRPEWNDIKKELAGLDRRRSTS